MKRKRTLIEEIDHYFETVSNEQLEKDLKAARLEFYGKMGNFIIPPPGYKKNETKSKTNNPKNRPSRF